MACHRSIPKVSGCCLFLLLSGPGIALAQETGCTQEPSDQAPASATLDSGPGPSASSSLRAYIDPQSGELIPGPAPGTAPDVDAAAAQDLPDLVEEVRPDGSVLLRLDERFHSSLRAETVAGKLVTCHDDVGQDGESHDQ